MKKKNILVITWFYSENYGTCLQAYAMHKVLSRIANVRFLDRRRYYPVTRWNIMAKKLLLLFKQKLRKKSRDNIYGVYMDKHNQRMTKIHEFTESNYNYVCINSIFSINKIDKWADCYLVGSDQMWNPWMLSIHYLLDFVPKNSFKPKYAYAASFGVDNIPENKKNVYKKYLPKFDKITVREPRALEIVKELSGKEATVVLDPTFLLTKSEWKEFSSKSRIIKDYALNKYVICYFIGSSEFNHFETIKKLSQKLNVRMVLLPTKPRDYQINIPGVTVVADACAYDFVSLIDNASLVFTDSFHAVVFSFLMNTSFYVLPRFKKGDKYSQESRLDNIMHKFYLTNSYWNSSITISDIKKHLITDYEEGYRVLDVERKNSIEILLEMVM